SFDRRIQGNRIGPGIAFIAIQSEVDVHGRLRTGNGNIRDSDGRVGSRRPNYRTKIGMQVGVAIQADAVDVNVRERMKRQLIHTGVPDVICRQNGTTIQSWRSREHIAAGQNQKKETVQEFMHTLYLAEIISATRM